MEFDHMYAASIRDIKGHDTINSTMSIVLFEKEVNVYSNISLNCIQFYDSLISNTLRSEESGRFSFLCILKIWKMNVKFLILTIIVVKFLLPTASSTPLPDEERAPETTWSLLYSNEIHKIDNKINEFKSSLKKVSLLCKISPTKRKCETFVALASKSVNSVSSVLDFIKIIKVEEESDVDFFYMPSINDVIKLFYC